VVYVRGEKKIEKPRKPEKITGKTEP